MLKNKHAPGATDKLPVLTESARMHVDVCVHEKETEMNFQEATQEKKPDLVTSLTPPLETIPRHDPQ